MILLRRDEAAAAVAHQTATILAGVLSGAMLAVLLTEASLRGAAELWIGYYKKGVPKTAMTYAEAVEEALCFGWIDGKARRIDDEVTGQRFTRRRKGSNWSAINIAKIADLSAAGRMHPAGLRAFEERDRLREELALMRERLGPRHGALAPRPRLLRASVETIAARQERKRVDVAAEIGPLAFEFRVKAEGWPTRSWILPPSGRPSTTWSSPARSWPTRPSAPSPPPESQVEGSSMSSNRSHPL